MHTRRSRYLRHRFPPDIISHAVWLYHRYGLSFRDVEDLLAERGIIVSYETIRQWCGKFGPDYARRLKRRQGRLGDTWFLDEVFITMNGQRQYLWRAVDQDGDLIDLLVQPRRDARAARRFFRRLLKGQRHARSSHRAMVLREWPVTRAVAEVLTPSTRRLATSSNSRRVQRRPLYAVPVFVLTVPLQTVHRYRRRRPDFVANEPWLTMLKPGFPRLSRPGVAHAIPSITLIAQVYRGGSTVSEVKLIDQQRPAQAPAERWSMPRLMV